MKLFIVKHDIHSCAPKGCLLYVQVRYTGIFILPQSIEGWCGSKIELFVPRKVDREYKLTGFSFQPWLAPDIAVCQLPKWYLAVAKAISFSNLR